MAIPADTVWEVNTTGSDTAAGGGFSVNQKGATGTDMTYPTPTVTTFTSNLSAVGTTALTCASALFTNTMLGNVIQISGQGFYCIQGFTSSTVVTVDRALGTFAATSGWVGGALASPGQASAQNLLSRSIVYVKAGTYSITSATAGVSGGCVLGGTNYQVFIGYSTTRSFGNTDTGPVFQLNASTATLVSQNSQPESTLYNFTLDGNGQTAAKLGGGIHVRNVIKNFNTASASVRCLYGCLVTANSATLTCSVGCVAFSEAYANTATPWIADCFVNSLSYSNTGATTDGFTQGGGQNSGSFGCVSASNGRDGWHNNGSGNNLMFCQNCVAESNTGAGFNLPAGSMLVNCSTFGNGSVSPTTVLSIGAFTPAATVFNGATDFSLNNLSAKGAALRAAAAVSVTNVFLRGLTTGYQDIGAAQSRASGGISRGRQVMD